MIFNYSASQFIKPVNAGNSHSVSGKRPLGISATGTSRNSSFIIKPITNHTIIGAHKTIANQAWVWPSIINAT